LFRIILKADISIHEDGGFRYGFFDQFKGQGISFRISDQARQAQRIRARLKTVELAMI